MSRMNEIVADINTEIKVKQDVRRKAGKMIAELLKPIYFNGIPFQRIAEVLEDNFKLIIIQEDGTRWSGFFCGEDGECFFRFGYEGKLVSNFGFKMTWHMMTSGRYEILGYLS